nr:MAG TPA: hypothetical protein [Caudoviricetes sp.]
MKKNKERDTSRDYAVLIDIPREDKEVCSRYGFNTCLKIVLYGDPFSDSRPKPNMKTGGIALVNQNLMKKAFKPFYERCELLKSLTILSPYLLKCNFFLEATEVDKKRIMKLKKYIGDLYYKEKLAHMGEKDVDNMIKIHNDIMLQNEFRIILTDGFNIGTLYSPKLITPNNPRAEVFVYFNNSKEKNDYYREKIEGSSHYAYWQLSYKNYKYQSNRTVKEQIKHMKRVVEEICTPIKSIGTMKRKLGRILEEFKYYPADVIKELAGVTELKSREFNRVDAEYKLSCILFDRVPLAMDLIKQGGKLLNEDTEGTFESFF